MRRLDAENAWALDDPALLKRQMVEAFRFPRQVAGVEPAPVRSVVGPSAVPRGLPTRRTNLLMKGEKVDA